MRCNCICFLLHHILVLTFVTCTQYEMNRHPVIGRTNRVATMHRTSTRSHYYNWTHTHPTTPHHTSPPHPTTPHHPTRPHPFTSPLCGWVRKQVCSQHRACFTDTFCTCFCDNTFRHVLYGVTRSIALFVSVDYC